MSFTFGHRHPGMVGTKSPPGHQTLPRSLFLLYNTYETCCRCYRGSRPHVVHICLRILPNTQQHGDVSVGRPAQTTATCVEQELRPGGSATQRSTRYTILYCCATWRHLVMGPPLIRTFGQLHNNLCKTERKKRLCTIQL